jgi:8-oxo-dGTP pyrophosphatase MutT (NUDIX family)
MSKYRRGVFVVAYSKSKQKNKIEYLILRRKHHWIGWEFPKGGINLFELKRHAAKREVREETGLKLIGIRKFNVHEKYKYKKEFPDRPGKIGQTFTLFGAEVKKGRVKIDMKEHSGFKWMTFREAERKLTWPNQKKCLRTVNNWLKNE